MRASSVPRPTNVARSARSRRTGNDAGADGDAFAQLVGELLRLVRWARAQPRHEPAAKLGVLGERGTPVAGGVEPAHQCAVDLLGERLERRLPPRQGDGAAQVSLPRGRCGKLLEQRHEALAVLVLRGQRPFLVEAREKRAVAERERLVRPSLRPEPVGLEHVDPRALCQADTIAGGDERLLAERAAEGPERAAEAGARALVEHVGPEDRGDGRPRLQARAQCQPRQQRARSPGRQRTALAVHLRGDLADESEPQHRQSVTRRP